MNTKLKAQLCAWLGGILIFFSDLGTPLLGGHGEYPPDGQSLHRQQCAGGSSARSSADRAAGLWRDAVSGRAVLRTQQGAERHRVPQRTGDALRDGPKGILKKRNKWFVAHPENTAKVAAGDYPGLLGAMREIK